MLRKNGFAFLFLLCVAFLAVSQERNDGILDTVEERPSSSRTRPDIPLRSFTIRNGTGYTVRNVFIRRATDAGWGDNLLTQPLYNGRSIFVRVGDSFDSSSLYCIRMVDIDGDVYAKNDIRIRESSRINMEIYDLDYEKY